MFVFSKYFSVFYSCFFPLLSISSNSFKSSENLPIIAFQERIYSNFTMPFLLKSSVKRMEWNSNKFLSHERMVLRERKGVYQAPHGFMKSVKIIGFPPRGQQIRLIRVYLTYYAMMTRGFSPDNITVSCDAYSRHSV